MYADLDQLVLSGKLFETPSRSSSPRRTPSPDHNAETAEEGDDYSFDLERQNRISHIMKTSPQDAPDGSIGMGPGRTGVKGVIRDRAEAQARAQERRKQEIAAMNARMERMNLGGRTYLEEERERELEKMMLEGAPPVDANALPTGQTGRFKSKFGHLREVGVKNFVSAVEKESKGVWVLVHLYDPSLDRCHELDSELSRLARLNPDTKFLRARASALGFASSSSSTLATTAAPRSNLRFSRRHTSGEDEDDPYTYDEEDITDLADEEDDNYGRDDDVDLDVLPTLLAYRDGELVHIWVRVDWETGRAGVEELLQRHRILKGSGAGLGNCGLPSDDEDLWDSE